MDSQFYIIDSLSLDVSLAWNANLVVALLYIDIHKMKHRIKLTLFFINFM